MSIDTRDTPLNVGVTLLAAALCGLVIYLFLAVTPSIEPTREVHVVHRVMCVGPYDDSYYPYGSP